MRPALLLVALAGCADLDRAEGEPTYWRDVFPVLASHCHRCHLNGPSSYRPWFDGYDHVAEVAGSIAAASASRAMPPWAVTADGTCRDWDHAEWLTDGEIGALEAWAGSDLAEGAPVDADAIVPSGRPSSPLRVDAAIDTGADYRPALGDRLHRCFRSSLSVDASAHLTAFRVSPGNPRAVQHVSMFALDAAETARQVDRLEGEDPDPGYHCFGGPGVADARLLGTWTWGEPAFRFPAGTGIRVEAGQDVVVQIHYNPNGGSASPHPDRTRIELELAAEAIEGRFLPFEIAELRLLPGQERAHASALFTVSDPMVVHGIFPFMHSLGGSLLLAHGTECMAEVRHWELYGHMRTYGYREPVAMAAGDPLWLECSYDTRSRSGITRGGDALEDESCRVHLYATSE